MRLTELGQSNRCQRPRTSFRRHVSMNRAGCGLTAAVRIAGGKGKGRGRGGGAIASHSHLRQLSPGNAAAEHLVNLSTEGDNGLLVPSTND